MLRSRSTLVRSLLLSAALLLPATVQPQSFPTKPIELVVHTNPGGGADLFGRYVADIINREKLLPQPVAVVNKAGGAHAVAANYAASRRGDPHVVLTIAHSSFLVVPAASGLDLGLDKFVPIALYGLDSHSVTVRADSPHKNLKDLIAAAKRAPKSVIVGVGSMGGTAHMLGYLLEKHAGVQLNYIGLKGGGEAILGVLGGHYNVCFENVSEIMDHVKANKLRVLAIGSEKRLPFMPDVPTLKEEGIPLTAGLGRGFVAPAGITKEAHAKLIEVFEKAHRTAAWKDYANRNVFEDVFLKGEQFGEWLKKEQPQLVQFARDAGLVKK
jgi:putative tricarboxylic transport membrane protein